MSINIYLPIHVYHNAVLGIMKILQLQHVRIVMLDVMSVEIILQIVYNVLMGII